MSCCFCIVCSVPEANVAIVTRLGKFNRTISAGGPNCIVPFYDEIHSVVSLKQIQMPLRVSAKTSDNTTISIDIMVQYAISEKNIYDAIFKLNDPVAQIRKYVEDVVRTKVADTTMVEVFEAKDDIASAVKQQLEKTMEGFGYDIRETPVTNVAPPHEVKRAMNEKNKKIFLFRATDAKTNRLKQLAVAKADAEMEKSKLKGMGIALQRTAIANGLNDTVQDFKKDVGGVSAKDVLELVLIIQYFDMMKDIGKAKSCSTTFLPGAEAPEDGIRNAMLYAGSK